MESKKLGLAPSVAKDLSELRSGKVKVTTFNGQESFLSEEIFYNTGPKTVGELNIALVTIGQEKYKNFVSTTKERENSDQFKGFYEKYFDDPRTLTALIEENNLKNVKTVVLSKDEFVTLMNLKTENKKLEKEKRKIKRERLEKICVWSGISSSLTGIFTILFKCYLDLHRHQKRFH